MLCVWCGGSGVVCGCGVEGNDVSVGNVYELVVGVDGDVVWISLGYGVGASVAGIEFGKVG